MLHLDQNNVLNPLQYRFRAGHSCTTQLFTMIAKSLDDRKQVDVNFAKAFDNICLQSYNIMALLVGLNTGYLDG